MKENERKVKEEIKNNLYEIIFFECILSETETERKYGFFVNKGLEWYRHNYTLKQSNISVGNLVDSLKLCYLEYQEMIDELIDYFFLVEYQ